MINIDIIRGNMESDYIKVTEKNISIEEWDKGLSDIGLDSLEFVELIVEIEDRYGFEFEDEMFFKDAFKSLNNICEYILLMISGNT